MASAYTKSLIKQFVAAHGNDIINAITDTGLFFAAVVAQLSVESTNGTSQLATEYNNYGGVKGNPSTGVRMDTTEVVNGQIQPVSAYFATYADFVDFMQKYVNTLQTNFANSGAFQATSPEAQITALVNAGYSTKSAAAYLATGVQDRINACRELFPNEGKISSVAPPVLPNVYCLLNSSQPQNIYCAPSSN